MKDDNLEQPSLLTSVEHIWKYSLDILKDIFKLFTLEVKLAGKSLATILILIVLAALLLLSSWFSLLGATVVWLMTFHISLVASLVLMSAINLTIAIGIAFYIAKISNNLQFKETRRQLGINEER